MTISLPPTRSALTADEMHAIQQNRELVADLERVVTGEVRFDGYSRMLYSTDASIYQVQPLGVVIPKNVEDVQATVEMAARHRVPVLARGGGSSLAGQAVGGGEAVGLGEAVGTGEDVGVGLAVGEGVGEGVRQGTAWISMSSMFQPEKTFMESVGPIPQRR
jgi:hypothetical protein